MYNQRTGPAEKRTGVPSTQKGALSGRASEKNMSLGPARDNYESRIYERGRERERERERETLFRLRPLFAWQMRLITACTVEPDDAGKDG